MRLTQIKLAGFKSFVDSTSFHVPGQLVGVVGPNGCGKSNIIDATRWVLGESKASELRGESMQDVIFNGSMHRKPAGRASVELVFDNSAEAGGKPLIGQWGAFNEISVKRVLTRDGSSTYYINQQAVRRRDVQDIFMGTGLGPRAYAIIGQGMISRIIEAKPDELRIFLEEAAGVSKYKERRRETENRLTDTRENLTRLEDIQRELTSQLDKLAGQAEVAQRYTALVAEGELKQHMLWLIKRGEAETEQQRHADAIARTQLEIDAQGAELRRIELTIEQLRQQHHAATDAMDAVHGDVLGAGAAVAKLEADIRYVVDSRNRIQAELATLAAQARLLVEQRQEVERETAGSSHRRDELDGELLDAEEAAATAQAMLPQAEAEVRDGLKAIGDLRAEVQKAQQAIELESARQRNAVTMLDSVKGRRDKLQAENRSLVVPDLDRLERQEHLYTTTEARVAEGREALATAQARVPEFVQQRREASEALNKENAEAHRLDARFAALKNLQASIAHKGKLEPWLQKHGMAELARLWQRVQIESGWESALESALRERIMALEVADLERARGFLLDAPPAKLTLYGADAAGAPPEPAPGLRSLLSLVKVSEPSLRSVLGSWLAGLHVADSVEQAVQQRTQLPAGASFIVREGHVVDRHSVRFHAGDDEQAGMLARQAEIDRLSRETRAQALQVEESRGVLAKADAAVTQVNADVDEAKRRLDEATRDSHQLQIEVLKQRQARDQYQARSTQLSADLADLDGQIRTQQAAIDEAAGRFDSFDVALRDAQTRHEDERTRQEQRDRQLNESRHGVRQSELAVQEIRFQQRSTANRLDELARRLAQLEQQHAAGEQRRVTFEAELATLDDQAAQAGLQQALEQRSGAEQRLAAARTELDSINATLRGHDEDRMKLERAIDPLRTRIVEAQLKEQAARLAREQFAEQLSSAAVDEAAVVAAIAEQQPKPSWLTSETSRIDREVAALGPVNLAALDELTTSRERKEFLDAQQADLLEAITTLETAIRNIDKETRGLLKDTFDQVNEHFGKLFPELFGGGESRLVMTGDEILDAGVQVMAQPPGKKNSTIHLLSGGEKALTAIALVFAIFQLNPAPFCLLDEVDAPLDDANTERFANMVKKMSSVTQFLFISHNKIAMEMANQLIGVTMQEQGVSRIVAVDIESAAGFVDTGSERAAA
ncbi:chromosome segregation protein SMC [soil metagenome]